MRTITFSDLVEINPRVQLRKAGEYPFIEMSVVEPGFRYVHPNQIRKYNGGGSKFMPGDVLFARITPCLENGKISQYHPNNEEAGFGSTEFFVFRARPEISEPGFVYYLVNSDVIRKPAEKSMSGASGRQRADLASIVNIELPFIPFPTQRKIASILSAYDDLIENNLRRIKILEEMAQNLYREWFVKFRFPGHEDTQFVDSPLGRIPEGWEVKPLLLLSDVTYGYAFKSKKFNSSRIGLPVIRIRDVLAGSSSTYSSEDPGPKYLVENGDILVGMDGEFHMGIWVGGKAFLVQRVARFRKKRNISIGNYYLFFALQEPIRTFNATITGTTVAHLGDKHIKTISILLPSIKIIDKVNSFIEPMLKQIISLRLKNFTLRQTRDLLLPKLISGEVDVIDIDIEIPETIEV